MHDLEEMGQLSQDYRDAATAVVSRSLANAGSPIARTPARGRSVSPVPRSLPVVDDRLGRSAELKFKSQLDAANEKVNCWPSLHVPVRVCYLRVIARFIVSKYNTYYKTFAFLLYTEIHLVINVKYAFLLLLMSLDQ